MLSLEEIGDVEGQEEGGEFNETGDTDDEFDADFDDEIDDEHAGVPANSAAATASAKRVVQADRYVELPEGTPTEKAKKQRMCLQQWYRLAKAAKRMHFRYGVDLLMMIIPKTLKIQMYATQRDGFVITLSKVVDVLNTAQAAKLGHVNVNVRNLFATSESFVPTLLRGIERPPRSSTERPCASPGRPGSARRPCGRSRRRPSPPRSRECVQNQDLRGELKETLELALREFVSRDCVPPRRRREPQRSSEYHQGWLQGYTDGYEAATLEFKRKYPDATGNTPSQEDDIV